MGLQVKGGRAELKVGGRAEGRRAELKVESGRVGLRVGGWEGGAAVVLQLSCVSFLLLFDA